MVMLGPVPGVVAVHHLVALHDPDMVAEVAAVLVKLGARCRSRRSRRSRVQKRKLGPPSLPQSACGRRGVLAILSVSCRVRLQAAVERRYEDPGSVAPRLAVTDDRCLVL